MHTKLFEFCIVQMWQSNSDCKILEYMFYFLHFITSKGDVLE